MEMKLSLRRSQSGQSRNFHPLQQQLKTSAKTWTSGRASQKSPSCEHQFISKAQNHFGRGGTREGESLRISFSTLAYELPIVSSLQLKIFLEEKSGQ